MRKTESCYVFSSPCLTACLFCTIIDINVSTARDLRTQLREIAPQNTEASYKFCPNGPSAAVSPLMENKCGDRLATPSVFGRSEDIAGNSIPGLANGRLPSSVSGSGALNTNPAVGGFPSYK